jgi:DNA-binding XRE family transcriptional regulator
MAKKARKLTQPETLVSLIMPVYQEKLESTVGFRLRELRKQQGLSLRALAEKSGLSANTISLIENGKTSPSVDTLQQISLSLNVPITTFFEQQSLPESVIFTKNESRKGVNFSRGIVEEMGTGVGSEGLQPIKVSLAPQTNNGPQPLTHEGSEFVFCLSGRVEYQVMETSYTLEPGDSLLFSSKIPHSWHNPLDTSSEVIIVMARHIKPDVASPVSAVSSGEIELSS